jgi:hypothetical protein
LTVVGSCFGAMRRCASEMAPLMLVLPWVPLWVALVAAAAIGFVVGRWWIVALAAVWPVYGSHKSAVHLEGNLELWLAFVTTLFIIGAIALGVATRWITGRARP